MLASQTCRLQNWLKLHYGLLRTVGLQALRKVFAEFFDLGFKFRGFGGGGFGESQADEVAGVGGGDGAVVGDAGDRADGDFAGAAVEAEVDTVAALGVELDRHPAAIGMAPGDLAAKAVVNHEVFEGLFDDRKQLVDDFEIPRRIAAIRESFAEFVPAAAEFFPGHQVFGVGGFGVAELQAGLQGFGKEFAKRRSVDFRFFPDLDGDFLPGCFEVPDADAWFAAVDRDLLHVIKGRQSEGGIEFFGGEGVFANAEAENQQPFAPGAGVEEPAESFSGADFHGRAIVPVGGCDTRRRDELANDPNQGVAVPAAGLAGAGEAVFGVPADAVDFPGQFGGACEFGDVHVAGFFGSKTVGVEDGDFATV